MTLKIFTAGEVLTAEDLNEQFQLIVNNGHVNTLNSLSQYTFSGNVVVNSSLIANSSAGSANQVLASNGSTPYWADLNDLGASVNTDAAYVWVNTHSFSNLVTFSNTVTFGNTTVNTVINSTSISTRDVTITGNLIVSGTTTSINTVSFNVSDPIVTLNSDHTGSPTDNVGFEVMRGTSTNAYFYFDETNDKWQANDNLKVSGTFEAGNSSITGYVNATVSVNSSILSVGSNFIANSTVLTVTTNTNISGTNNQFTTDFRVVNSSANALFVGSNGNVGIANNTPAHKLTVDGITSFGNTSVAGFVNATVSVNSTLLTVGTNFIANTSGAYHTGTVNAALLSTASFTANSTLVNATALNVTNQINTSTFYATLSANIASVVQANASGLFNTANTVLGSDSTDIVTFNALANSNLIPASNATYDLGSTTLNWNRLYTNSVIGTTATFTGNVVVGGDFVISGNTVSLSGNVITFTDNMLYLNQGILTTITAISSNGTHVIFTANNNFSAGWDVIVTGVTPSSYNGTYHNIFAANSTTFTVANTNVDAYVSGGSARGKSDVNPDLGFAAGYNDGTYHHTGFFRDASDGRWKVFDNYTPEPDTSIYIDTTDASFHLADFQANTLYLGNTSVNWFISNTTGIYHTGTVNAASFSVGTAFTANSTVVNAVAYNVGTNFIANTAGVYHSGTVNAASHTVGTVFIANTTKLSVNTTAADANVTAGVAVDINGAVLRVGDALSALTMANGVGIKLHDAGNQHYSLGQLGGKFYISVTGSDGNSLFPVTRTDALTVIASGNVGIGNTSPTDKLSVNGNTYISSNLQVVGTINTNSIAVSGNLTLASTGALIANSSAGSNGQVLTSNGTAAYWSNAGGGFNLDGGAPDSIYGGITSIDAGGP